MPELCLSEENVLSAAVKSEFRVCLLNVTFSSSCAEEWDLKKFSYVIIHHTNHRECKKPCIDSYLITFLGLQR